MLPTLTTKIHVLGRGLPGLAFEMSGISIRGQGMHLRGIVAQLHVLGPRFSETMRMRMIDRLSISQQMQQKTKNKWKNDDSIWFLFSVFCCICWLTKPLVNRQRGRCSQKNVLLGSRLSSRPAARDLTLATTLPCHKGTDLPRRIRWNLRGVGGETQCHLTKGLFTTLVYPPKTPRSTAVFWNSA